MAFLTSFVCMYKWPLWPFDMPIGFDIPISFDMFPSLVILDSLTMLFPFSFFLNCIRWNCPYVIKLFVFVSIAENLVELDPSHVRLGDEGLVTTGAFGCGGFVSPSRIGKRVMSEVEETPAVRFSEPLAVFYSHIHAIVLTVEIP